MNLRIDLPPLEMFPFTPPVAVELSDFAYAHGLRLFPYEEFRSSPAPGGRWEERCRVRCVCVIVIIVGVLCVLYCVVMVRVCCM